MTTPSTPSPDAAGPIDRAVRSTRFNETTGTVSWHRKSVTLHPDRCVCQGDDPTPHKHYPAFPHSCARCSDCHAYSPAVSPLSSSGRTPDPDGSIPVCIRRWDEKLQQVVFAPLPAASPEGSAGLDAEKKKVLAAIIGGGISQPDEHGVRVICLGYHPEQDEYEWLRVVPESSLIDASRERDRLAWIHKQNSEVLLESMREADQLKVQLTDARCQLEAEKETRLEDLADQRKEWERANAAEDQVESLRRSREQAIAAIDGLPTFQAATVMGLPTVARFDSSDASGPFIERSAVLSILRGAE